MKKAGILFTILLILLTLNTINADTISGRVIDIRNKTGLGGANIIIQGTAIGCAADADGYFELDVSGVTRNEFKIKVSYIGFHPDVKHISLPTDQNELITIALKESYLKLDQIVVTGTRTERFLKNTPVTTQVIDKTDLKNTGGTDISEALQEFTGITVNYNQFGTGVNTIELQGFGSEHVLMMVDGIKMIGRVNGELDLSQIPVSQVERLEVVKGASSSLYGSEALGGVINIITKQPSGKLKVNLWGNFGSYERINSGITLSMPFGKWHSGLNFAYRHYGGYDLSDQTASEDATAYQKYNGQLDLKGNLTNDLKLGFQAIYFTEMHEVVSSLTFKDQIHNDHYAFRSSVEKKAIGSWLNLKSSLEFSQHDHVFDRVVVSSGYLKKGSLTADKLAKADILFDFEKNTHTINGGYAFEYEAIDSDRVVGEHRNTTLHNIFIQDEVTPLTWFTVVGGFRYDAHSVYGTQFSPKISMMFSPQHNKRVRLSYGKGFRAPAFKELYIDYTNISVGYHIIGNPELKTEKSDAYQIDFEFWNSNNYHTRIHLFHNEIENLIDYDWQGIIDGYGTYRTENLLSVRTWGGEWDMEYFPNDWLKITVGYSYLDSENEETGEPLSFKSKHRSHGAIKIALNDNINFNVRGRYEGKRFYWETSDENPDILTKERIDGYLLLNTHAVFTLFQRYDVSLGIKNLTDYVDKVWGPMPGRELYGGLSFAFDNNNKKGS